MFWLIGPLIIVVLVLVAGYRKTALGLFVGVIIAGILTYWLTLEVQEHAATRISVSEIGLDKVAFRRTFDASYELTGRITNKSETYRIDGVSFTVKMRGCAPADPSNCVDAGEAIAHVAVAVPPLETRGFIGTLYFGKGHKEPKGTLAWDYEISAIMAKRQ